MLSYSEDNQSDVIEAFNSTSQYLDDLLNIDNNFFDMSVVLPWFLRHLVVWFAWKNPST